MEIANLDTNSIRIRGKHASLVVDPQVSKSKAKITADAIVLLRDFEDLNFPNVENYRLVIKGPGEYEINGAMLAGRKVDSGCIYKIILDGMNIILGSSNGIDSISDKIDSCQILILNVDSQISQSIIASLEPQAVILYGDKKLDAAKTLDKGNSTTSQKFVLTKDKLSEGTQIMILG